MSDRRSVIACFGEALVDLLTPAGVHAAPLFKAFAGGAPANVAVAVARQGGHARYIGMLAKDFFGEFLRAELGQAGVDLRDVQYTAGAPTGLAFVALDADGERSFQFYRPPAADLKFRAEALAHGAFADVAVLHLCSNSLSEPGSAFTTLEVLRRARAAGAWISMDVNLRPALWGPDVNPALFIWHVLAQADVVKLSRSEADFLAYGDGEEMLLQRLWLGATRLLVITEGCHGLKWFTRCGRGQLKSYAIQCVDSTAAGDAFAGGMLWALVEGGQDLATVLADAGLLEQVLRRGAASGALAATRNGAFAAMPAASEVDALIRAQP